MRSWKNVGMAGIAALFLAGPASASYDGCSTGEDECLYSGPGYYDGYDDSQSHPLRLAAYALHPVGFALEWLVTRPIHAIVSQPELERVFGHTPHGWNPCCGIPKASAVPPPPVAPPPAASPVDIDAARRAAEEARAAAEEAKRAAEEAARAAEKATRGFEKSLRK
jgi:hypothetical protein